MPADTNRYIGDELELFALANNWKGYWSVKIRPFLSNKVLEVGAGIGSNMSSLKDEHHYWTAVEPDPVQAEKIKQLKQNRVDSDSIEVVCGTIADLPDEQQFDSIIYIDVLEHIENDRHELKTALRLLNNGGQIIVLAPAHQSLFSPFDEHVGHWRRYDDSSLRALIPAGAKCEQIFYLDSVGYSASWLNSRLLKSSVPNRTQIWLWDSFMVPLSRVVDKLTRFKFGKSIVIVIRKVPKSKGSEPN